MRLAISVSALLLVAAASEIRSQQSTPVDSTAVHYYDSWPGVWHRVRGERIDSLPTFEIRRGPGNSFLESWYLVIDGKRTRSFGLRSWDPEMKTWRLVWVADPSFFQIWDGIRQPDGWYIIRRFGEGATSFLSRQAWIPRGPDRLFRTIERSTDGGRSWTVRTRDEFQRIGPGPGRADPLPH